MYLCSLCSLCSYVLALSRGTVPQGLPASLEGSRGGREGGREGAGRGSRVCRARLGSARAEALPAR
eukprot:9476123-Pyramimonas_sp.AAC.1